jgi:predicted kinase
MPKQEQAPLLILIAGPSGTGKTSLSHYLAPRLGLPLQSKDQIKELLLDAFGWDDLEASRKMGEVSMRLLYQFAELQLAAGQSCIIESPFAPQEYAIANLKALQERFAFVPVQIQCHTERTVLYQRLQRRAVSAERHPGHLDKLKLDLQNVDMHSLREGFDPLPIGGYNYSLDTTNDGIAKYDDVLKWIQEFCLAR